MAKTRTAGRQHSPAPSRGTMSARWIVAAVLAVLALVFVLQNRDTVSLQLFAIEASAPLWAAFLSTLVVGAAIGWLLFGRDHTHS